MSSIIQEAEFWVAIGMVILFVALLWAKVPGLAFKALDDRGAKIQAALDEALALRQEAQQVLVRIKAEREAAEHVAAEMIKNATPRASARKPKPSSPNRSNAVIRWPSARSPPPRPRPPPTSRPPPPTSPPTSPRPC